MSLRLTLKVLKSLRYSTAQGLLALVAFSALVGCYDAKALIEARRAVAVRARLVEIDLGEYRVTLPRPYTELERAEVNFHVFGQVSHNDLANAKQSLEEFGPDLRHRLLLAVRQMKMTEIADPSLTSLRESITNTVNEMIEGDPVKSVGFYSFTFSNY